MFNRRNRNNNNGSKPKRRNLNRRNHVRTQNFAGVSHRDSTRQVRKFTSFTTCTLLNAQGEQSFGVSSLSVTPSVNSSIGRSLASYIGQYEEYRVRRVRARVICGRGYTNDRRIKSLVAARVDTNYVDSSDTWSNVQSIVQSENSVIKTFTERGNVLIADFKPIQFNANYPTTVPTIPNAEQWFRLQNYADHTWRGGVIALILSETGIQPNEVSVNVTLECDVEFRGRVQDSSQYSGSRLFVNLLPNDEIPTPPLMNIVEQSIEGPTNKLDEKTSYRLPPIQ